MISKYDHLLVGLLVALAVATIGFAIASWGVDIANKALDLSMNFRQRSLALIGICLNVIPLNYFRNHYWIKSLRGVVIGTFLLAVVWFFKYGQALLETANG